MSDYICITDIAKQRNPTDPNGVIANWMRNRNTIEFLGLWETLYNPNSNPLEFEGVRMQAGLNAFTLSSTQMTKKRTHIYQEYLLETDGVHSNMCRACLEE